MKIDLYRRVDNNWKLFRYRENNIFELSSIDFHVSVVNAYQDEIGLLISSFLNI